jgi:hypothetical protein
MKLAQFKSIIDNASAYAADTDPRVEVWFGDHEYQINRISQGQALPNVRIELMELSLEADQSSGVLSVENLPQTD